MTTEFAGGDLAALYVKYRPKAAPQVIDKVLGFLKDKKPPPFTTAIDVACGSGQCTQTLGEHFQTVVGIDVSEAQMKEARKATTATNIKYSVADAEHIPASDGSVDLVTCSHAAHWFNFPTFCKEADRVLVPSGVLAIFAHGYQTLLHQNKNVAEKLNELYHGCWMKTLGPYWNYSVHPILWNGYVDLNIPYPEFQRTVLQEYTDESLSSLIGHLRSLSAYQKFHKDHPDDDILTKLQDKILETLQVDSSPDETILQTVYPIYLLLGRKPQER